MSEPFGSYAIAAEDTLFEELADSARFEDVAKGRQGAVLVDSDTRRGVPIVRTTSRYEAPAQRFAAVHRRLAEQVRTAASLADDFNNALFEAYSNAYAKMGFHSDQDIDLARDSHIAIFSCYEHPPDDGAERMLIVEPKEGGDRFEISLPHHSAVVFSTETNRHFKHKIVLDKSRNWPDNCWLGLTFRVSQTFVRFDDDKIVLGDGTPLTLADEDEQREFFQLRGRENREPDFVYPRLTYTVSRSDLVRPV